MGSFNGGILCKSGGGNLASAKAAWEDHARWAYTEPCTVSPSMGVRFEVLQVTRGGGPGSGLSLNRTNNRISCR